ncbi:MAG: hypothetical protein A2020_10795 [Lentisphaerae bacterium GWF2_45_14]|nr:MAG: hypothetical protein A2020_10795 [Lentisphaerae bacterium GWF2_45_14]
MEKTENNTYSPEKPLAHEKWEEFCQLYAGECWGDAEKAFKSAGLDKDPATKKAAPGRPRKILQIKEIYERILYLRKIKFIENEMDSLWIAQRRKEIVEKAEKESDRLNALKDLEKAIEALSAAASEKNGPGVTIVFNSKDKGIRP